MNLAGQWRAKDLPILWLASQVSSVHTTDHCPLDLVLRRRQVIPRNGRLRPTLARLGLGKQRGYGFGFGWRGHPGTKRDDALACQR
jgi:hypothetical protein